MPQTQKKEKFCLLKVDIWQQKIIQFAVKSCLPLKTIFQASEIISLSNLNQAGGVE